MEFRELMRYRSLKEEITDLENRIKELNGEIASIPKDFAAPERLGIELAKCKDLLKKRKRQSITELTRLERVIDQCDDPYIRCILRYRFCNGLSWTAVAKRLGNNSPDSCRMIAKRYLKRKK